MHNRSLELFIVICNKILCCAHDPSGTFNFQHKADTAYLPATDHNWHGTSAIGDYDNDGDQDFIMSVTREKVYRFAMVALLFQC